MQEWDLLLDFADKRSADANVDLRLAVAPLVANAAWSVGELDKMDHAISFMGPPENEWYAAVSATMHKEHTTALVHIDNARDMLCDELGEFLAPMKRKGDP